MLFVFDNNFLFVALPAWIHAAHALRVKSMKTNPWEELELGADVLIWVSNDHLCTLPDSGGAQIEQRGLISVWSFLQTWRCAAVCECYTSMRWRWWWLILWWTETASLEAGMFFFNWCKKHILCWAFFVVEQRLISYLRSLEILHSPSQSWWGWWRLECVGGFS